MYDVNYEFPSPISAFVADSFLYDDDKKQTGYSKCKILALNFYPGEAPTVTILLEDGSLFDYCPMNVLKHKFDDNIIGLSLKDLSYNNNVSSVFVVTQYQYFLKTKLTAYFKQANKWLEIRNYICSIDWALDNDKKHFCILSDGSFAFIPNHKLKIGNSVELSFKQYKKISSTYKV